MVPCVPPNICWLQWHTGMPNWEWDPGNCLPWGPSVAVAAVLLKLTIIFKVRSGFNTFYWTKYYDKLLKQ